MNHGGLTLAAECGQDLLQPMLLPSHQTAQVLVSDMVLIWFPFYTSEKKC